MTKSKSAKAAKKSSKAAKIEKFDSFENVQLTADQLNSVKGGNGEVVNDDTIIEEDILDR